MKQTIINKLSVFSNENPTLLGSIATNTSHLSPGV